MPSSQANKVRRVEEYCSISQARTSRRLPQVPTLRPGQPSEGVGQSFRLEAKLQGDVAGIFLALPLAGGE